ncbi:alpha-tubulin N-acetyltransferase 2 isoform X2 [Drosophila ficusphila]|nr:alpha-tubulin N-acetyltransferase 2 isoform X2 [Drosophila ficusphila]
MSPVNRGSQRSVKMVPSCQLSQILDAMGQLSAVAQGLRQPVTTAEKLMPNQVVYLMADNKNGNWMVTGLLKVGTKDLFLFDKQGSYRRADGTPAILDFYIHESRQRHGLGKMLFQRMLDEQGWTAGKCSVDRPSTKLLAFLGKHYNLVKTIPQGNNFVLYEGFFDEPLMSRGRQANNVPRNGSQSQGRLMWQGCMPLQQGGRAGREPRRDTHGLLQTTGGGANYHATRSMCTLPQAQSSRAKK